MGTRRQGRIAAFQALYAWEETAMEMDELVSFSWMDKAPDEQTVLFASLIVRGTVSEIEAVDGAIKLHLKKWSFERVNKVDLAVLRAGAYALLFQKDIPATVTIDESVEIAKRFGAPESYRFVNGVLDGISKAELS